MVKLNLYISGANCTQNKTWLQHTVDENAFCGWTIDALKTLTDVFRSQNIVK